MMRVTWKVVDRHHRRNHETQNNREGLAGKRATPPQSGGIPGNPDTGAYGGAGKTAQRGWIVRSSQELRELSARLMHTQDQNAGTSRGSCTTAQGKHWRVLGMHLGATAREGETPRAAVREKSRTKATTLLQQLNREIRTTSYLLHPPLLDEAGFGQCGQRLRAGTGGCARHAGRERRCFRQFWPLARDPGTCHCFGSCRSV